MAGDIITDYSAIVGDTFVHYAGQNPVDNGDGTFTVTLNEVLTTQTIYVQSATNGDPDQFVIDGSVSYVGQDQTVDVVGHNSTAIVTTYPGYSSYVLGLTDGTLSSGDTVTYSLTDPNAPMGTVICFAEGTNLTTDRGAVRVEALEVGDMVITASGEARAIKWIGQMTAHPAKHPHPWEVNPVRVKAGAFGEGVPARDIRLSPGHAVYVDGVLIPVGHLVNGATIFQEEVDRIRYFHVELDSHDVLIAEGLACESYLDDGNRSTFHNAEGAVVLNGRLDPKSWDEACAPMVAAGPQLEDVQRRLAARAEEMGWVRVEDAGLHLIADGSAIEPMLVEDGRARFAVPACRELTLASNAAVIAQLMPGLTDQRRLGVAVSELRLDGELLDLASDAFGEGFHELESHGEISWRWTDGQARLSVGLSAPAVVEVAIHMVAPSWKRAVAELELAAVG
jgi:hypothetical protein